MISPTDSAPVKVVKGAAFIFAGLIFARVVNYAYRILLARAGGMEEFGLLFLGISTVSVVGGLAGLGLDQGVARFVPLYIGKKEEGRLRGVLRHSLVISLCSGFAAGVLLWFAAPLIAVGFFDNEPLVPILHICALCLPFYVSGRSLVKAVVAFQRIGYRVAVNQVANPFTRFILTLFLVAAGMGADGAMWAYLASEFLSWFLLLWLLQKRVFPFLGPAKATGASFFEARAFFTYSLPLFFAGIIDLVLHYTDAFMLEYFLDTSQVGIYGAAVTLVSLAALGTELLNPMFLSIITQEYTAGNLSGVVSTYNNNNRWLQYITLPIVALLVTLPAGIMFLLWGEGFSSGASALIILTLGRTVFYLASTSVFVLYMHGATRIILAANFLSALLNVVLNYSLIPRLGITGAALATAVSLALPSVALICAARLYHRGLGMQVVFPRILAAASVPAIFPLLVQGHQPMNWIRFAAAGSGYLALYFGFLKLFRVFSEEDYSIWRKIVTRLKGKEA